MVSLGVISPRRPAYLDLTMRWQRRVRTFLCVKHAPGGAAAFCARIRTLVTTATEGWAVRRRKCFLLVDTEMPESLSTRKLMLQSGKFNVISVYSGEEALEEFERFPRVEGVILHSDLSGNVTFCDVAGKIKSADQTMFVLVLAPS